jgi:hypothetical protein
MARGAAPEAIVACVAALSTIVNAAKHQWSFGDPEQPPTHLVATELARALFDHHCYEWWDHRRVRP